jgi:integrase
LNEVNRAQIESLLSKLRQKGHANGTLRGVRTTVSTVLQCAVDRHYLDGNAAHGIRIRTMGVKPKPHFYTPAQVQKLLPELTEPCRSVVQVAVLTGMRIGEILGLRWKRVDLLHKTLEVAEIFSDGDFGTPKTNSSDRVLPISSTLCEVFEAQRPDGAKTGPDDLLFTTPRGTPLSSKNL